MSHGEQYADVVVVGGGGAALIAACRARELGAEVILLSKKRPGLASCTAYAGGGFTAPVGGMDRMQYRKMVENTGRGIGNPELLDILDGSAQDSLEKLQDWGVHLQYREGGASVSTEVNSPMLNGTGLTFPLVEAAKKMGVTIRHPFEVTGLLQGGFGESVRGVVGVQESGETRHIYGRAVILATGGGGRLYSRTDNPAGISGDGYALALAAGARLRDMEFVQFYPLGSVGSDKANWFIGAHLLDHLRLTDGNGDKFLPSLLNQWGLDSGREVNLFARDRLSVEIQRRRQKTGEVVLHLEDADEKLRSDPAVKHLARLFSGDSSDPFQPVQIAPIQHFMSGGVVIDQWGATEVDGLFACGEVTGGIHGANRVGGNALTELTTFSLRAAEGAVSREAGMPTPKPETKRAGVRFRLPCPSKNTARESSGENPAFGLSRLTELMIKEVGPVRRGKHLDELLRLLNYWAQKEDDWQVQSSLAAAGAITSAAAHRRESRGCHWRADYPEEGQEKFAIHVLPKLIKKSSNVSEIGLDVTRKDTCEIF